MAQRGATAGGPVDGAPSLVCGIPPPHHTPPLFPGAAGGGPGGVVEARDAEAEGHGGHVRRLPEHPDPWAKGGR